MANPVPKPTDDGVLEDEEPKGPPVGKHNAARVVLHSLERILEVVGTESTVTRAWLRRRENHKSEQFRLAVFLLVHDGESVHYSDIVSALNILVPKDQNPSDEVLRIYKSVKAELGMDAEMLKRFEAVRKVLYFGSKDDKRDPPRSILGLLGRPTSLRTASTKDGARRTGKAKPATEASLMQARAARVLATLADRGPMSSAGLSSQLQLKYPAVMRVMQYLMQNKRVVPIGVRKFRRYQLPQAAAQG